jgi:hypothetical protein
VSDDSDDSGGLEAFGYRRAERVFDDLVDLSVGDAKHLVTLEPMVLVYFSTAAHPDALGIPLTLELADGLIVELEAAVKRARERHYE